MKINKLITLICLLGLAMGSVSAIEEAPIIVEEEQTAGEIPNIEEKQQTEEKISIKEDPIVLEKQTTASNSTYTNDVHSIFSLKDCINIAIENNPDIRASFHNEQV